MIQISAAEVEKCLTMEACIPLMREALVALSSGKAHQVVRLAMPIEGRNLLGLMPAALLDKGISGVKVLSVFPDNAKKGLHSHQGQVLVFENEGGSLLAAVDAGAITGVRTAAASAVATDALALKDSPILAILGAGLQGRQHVSAIRQVRDIREIRVWDIRPEASQAFAKEIGAETGLPVTVCDTAHAACENADIICTLTPAKEPIIDLADVKPGAHINAVGACSPNAREIGGSLMGAGRVFTDWQKAALLEAGDILLAEAEGLLKKEQVAGEVGAVLTGALEGRQNETQITIFEALGQATEDLMAADYILEKIR